MHSLITSFVLCSVTSSVFSKPYEYSYYLSLPGHYQSLSVRDGAVSINNSPPLALDPGPGFRQGRVDPAFNPNTGIGRQFPGPQNPTGPNFRQPGINPSFNSNPGFDQRYPVFPGSQGGSNYSPQTINPSFGRRYPDQDEPDFIRGRSGPEEIPEDEIDPQFNQGGRYPGDLEKRRFNPNNPDNLPNGGLDPQFNRGQPGTPEFGTRIQPIPRRREITTTESSRPRGTEQSNIDDREEITTPNPCSFCGVNKINPMDTIDSNNVNSVNPDSEAVEPRNSGGGSADPRFGVPNGITPVSFGFPGYSFQSPFATYYLVTTQ